MLFTGSNVCSQIVENQHPWLLRVDSLNQIIGMNWDKLIESLNGVEIHTSVVSWVSIFELLYVVMLWVVVEKIIRQTFVLGSQCSGIGSWISRWYFTE